MTEKPSSREQHAITIVDEMQLDNFLVIHGRVIRVRRGYLRTGQANRSKPTSFMEAGKARGRPARCGAVIVERGIVGQYTLKPVRCPHRVGGWSLREDYVRPDQ